MALEVITPAFATSFSHKLINLRDVTEVTHGAGQQRKVADSKPSDFVIDKEEIMSILSLGLPALSGSKEPKTDELHTIDIFA